MTELIGRDGDNRYIIIDEQLRHLLLECVWFCAKEDLGDQIYCVREGQKIWVAKYFTDHMKRIEVEP